MRASGRAEENWVAERFAVPTYEALHLVATGLYSSGKSTILQALTGDRTIEINADITTSVAASYRWNDILLVDTPGVRAGIADHDKEADRELRRADFILFVVSVNLPDDDAREHLQYVTERLGRAEECILVLNKTSLSAADPSIRLGSLRDLCARIGINPPIVMIDALDFLLAADQGDPEDRLDLVQRSNFAALVEEINALTRRRGTVARLNAPLRSLILALDEARVRIDEPGWERDARRLLLTRSALLETARMRLLNRIAGLESAAQREIEEMGESLGRGDVPRRGGFSLFALRSVL